MAPAVRQDSKTGRFVKGGAIKTDEERFWERIIKTESCWLWTGHKVRKGYGGVSFRGKDMRAHRVSWIIHNGEIPDGLHVCHKCDNPACVNPDHLWLGTNHENRLDSMRKGRTHGGRFLGVLHPSHKLTEEDVLEIRFLYSSGSYQQQLLGLMFGVDFTTIGDIVRLKSWKHLEEI